MNNPKCPYCGDEQYLTIEDHSELGRMEYYLCIHCGSRSPTKTTIEEAYAAAMKRENKCKTYAEDFKEHFGHSWNNKDKNWQCRGSLYNDITDCVYSPRYDCEACWNEEMEANDE